MIRNYNDRLSRDLACARVSAEEYFRKQAEFRGTTSAPVLDTLGLSGSAGAAQRKMEIYLHRLIKGASGTFDGAEIFNFRGSWPLVQPHLRHPKVLAALKRGMEDFIAYRAAECIRLGISPKHWHITYDARIGPWEYDQLDFRTRDSVIDNTDETVLRNYAHDAYYWEDLVTDRTNQAIANGQFKWDVKGEVPSDEELEVYALFEAQFFPKPDTYQWYQLRDRGSYWLAGWLKELGELVFPKLKWLATTDKVDGHAEGHAEKDGLKVIFDILHFEPQDALAKYGKRPGQPNDNAATN